MKRFELLRSGKASSNEESKAHRPKVSVSDTFWVA